MRLISLLALLSLISLSLCSCFHNENDLDARGTCLGDDNQEIGVKNGVKNEEILEQKIRIETNQGDQGEDEDGHGHEGCGCGAKTARIEGEEEQLKNVKEDKEENHEGLADEEWDELIGEEPAYDPDEMVLIKEGFFHLGTDTPYFPQDGEGPMRKVFVDPFYMDAYEVSNREFAKFLRATNHLTDAQKFGWSFVFYQFLSPDLEKQITQAVSGAEWWLPVDGADWRHPEGPGTNITKRIDHPVVHVSHDDAEKFCQWKNKRLPTEAEWEKASRAGYKQKLFSWGNKLTPKGEHRMNIWQGKFPTLNTAEDGFVKTCPVNHFPPNRFGLYNMLGNVWEYTSSFWQIDHSVPAQNTGRYVSKGGSFMCHKSYCYRYRNEARTKNYPQDTTGNMGFRCVKDAPPVSEQA